jgi:hypothetical protein
MPINQQFDAISLCLVGLDCPASWDHSTKLNHGPLVALAINFSGNRQTFSNRLKFSILKPAATGSRDLRKQSFWFAESLKTKTAAPGYCIWLAVT